ncbi:MAG: hypothetical protein J3K34DRAFT_422443 [Monoraphidium minutum]|nr:MAG: hypothetical protein J3K34DRAFT_422443 [Monoraphidium minutum]
MDELNAFLLEAGVGRPFECDEDIRSLRVVCPLSGLASDGQEEAFMHPPPGMDLEEWRAKLAEFDVGVPDANGTIVETHRLYDAVWHGGAFYTNHALWPAIEPLVTHLVVSVYKDEVDIAWLGRCAEHVKITGDKIWFVGLTFFVRSRCLETDDVHYPMWFPTNSPLNFQFEVIGGKGSSGGGGTGRACFAPLYAALDAPYPVLVNPKSPQVHRRGRAAAAGWAVAVARFGQLQLGARHPGARVPALDMAFLAMVRAKAGGASREAAAAAAEAEIGGRRGWLFEVMVQRVYGGVAASRIEYVRARLDAG